MINGQTFIQHFIQSSTLLCKSFRVTMVAKRKQTTIFSLHDVVCMRLIVFARKNGSSHPLLLCTIFSMMGSGWPYAAWKTNTDRSMSLQFVLLFWFVCNRVWRSTLLIMWWGPSMLLQTDNTFKCFRVHFHAIDNDKISTTL